MSNIFEDFFDFVGDTASDVGDVLDDAWHAIKANPIGAITSVVAMSYGIPPAWAGALAGGVSAAATGGDIIKGAFTGGAMGYMGSMAGAATGAYGPIAQAAAMGATSAATGAVLTGQDVLTAVKAGLILGGVSGGVAKLMTPSEAIASVTPESLADIYASGQDPLGALIEQQGWTSSDSAIAAASEVFSRNAATTQQMLKDSIPDNVLAEARAATASGGDQNAYIADKMGWDLNGRTAQAAQTAFNDYVAASKVAAPAPIPKTQAEIQAAKVADIANTGLVNSADATVLNNAGFTPSDMNNLVKLGYSATDIVDMASTGVSAQTLTNLASTSFTEAAINNLLTSGVSANDIAGLSQMVNQGQLTTNQAQTLLDKGFTATNASKLINSGRVDAAITELNSGVAKDAVLNPPQQAVAPTRGTYAQAQAAQQANPGGTLTKSNGVYTYTPPEVKIAAPVTPSTPVVSAPVTPPTIPAGTVDVGNGNFMDTSGNIVDINGNITKPAIQPSAPVSQTATGYTPQQEAQYNELIRSGMTPGDAVKQISNAGNALSVDVTGGAGYAENPTAVVNEYRTPNTDLASQAQIDSKVATYNAGANAWEVPKVQAPTTPIVPVIVPPVVQPVTQPVTPPVVTPPAPVAPTTPPPVTTVSSSTRTTYDGSTYRDDQKSDGTVVTTLISGPSTGGTGTGTGTVTTPQQPLTPPVTEVITPGSSYVAPVDVTSPTTPNTPVEVLPETPTTPTTPIVPIVPPVTTPPATEDGSYSYKFGTAPKITGYRGLNPGYIQAVQNYATTNPAQSKYYWGEHPFQAGTTFDPTLANTLPNAPVVPFGATYAQTAATPEQILAKMQGTYPLLGTTGVNGPVRP